MAKYDSVLKKVLKEIEPTSDEVQLIDKETKNFVSEFRKILKAKKIVAEVFVGGSYAKKTLVKKGVYDIDVFVRFDKKYKDDELSGILEKLLKKWVYKAVHGSRDYFQININEFLFLEIVPVRKVKKPEESVNITDLSYSHVKWINKNLKTKKILDDIKLAKAFAHGCNCYGAESYISGFSGYSLELLVYKYKGFVNMLKAISKIEDKTFIDVAKHYKNKNEILIELNDAKMISPIVLIDPTFRERNALAALSQETFSKFKNYAQEFIKKPSVDFFKQDKINFEFEKQDAKKKKLDCIIIEVSTEKQEGDIAGSKMLKFYRHLALETARFFEIKKRGFEYVGGNSAKFFITAKPKKEIKFVGPNKKDKKHVAAFKKKHKGVYEKSGRLYARARNDFSLKSFISDWKKKYSEKIENMDVSELKVVN